MDHYLGVDIGGTTLRAAVATESGAVVADVTLPTPGRSSDRTITDEVRRLVERVCEDGGLDPADVAAAGVGSVGPIDREAGTIVGPANAGGDGPIPVVEPIREVVGTGAVALHNDAVCGVVAERECFGSVADDLVYLTLSTGIGAGVVADGNVVLGRGGNAAEVGHTTIDPAGTMRCGCGREGHWEAYCGGANVPRYAEHLHREGRVETELPVAEEDLTAKDVFDGVGEDELADLVAERVGRWNAIGVANVVQAFAPSTVAVGGAVALANPATVLDPIREQVPDRVTVDVPEIRVSRLGTDAVLRGALLTARRLG